MVSRLSPQAKMKKLFATLGMVCVLAGGAFAQKDDMKDAAHSTGDAAKKTGKKMKKGAKKAANKTADATKDGADKVKDKTN
jgi:hypothetical protein